MMSTLLSALVLAAPEPLALDVGLAASSNFSPEVFFAQRTGPRLSLGLTGLPLGPLNLGARVGLQYDFTLHRAFELQAQVHASRRFGLFEPSLGVGTNVFLEAGRGAQVFGVLGLSLRPGQVVDVFLDLAPGVLVDRFGPSPWLMVALGVRFHLELPLGPRG
ncbi:MAG: hypothetical protein SFW67_18875 [Myxococcaceae bacterium]|nr:hypothetical protein [Myxococcaceae bacterium]